MRRISSLRQVALLLLLSLYSISASAIETQGKVQILITPKNPVLPPDVGTYKSDPGNYFDVSIISTAEQELFMYFGMQLEYVYDEKGMAVNDLSVSTPVDRPTNVPYIISPKTTTTLSREDLRRLFNHIPTSALNFDTGILDRLGTSDFGLLPEGEYRARLTAYLWDRTLINQDGRINSPVALSDPENTGFCTFEVCYKAQAPQFTTPTSMLGIQQTLGLPAIKMDMSNPVFTWTEPILNCRGSGDPLWQYNVVIKEVARTDKSEYMMTPEQALEVQPFVIRMPALTSTQYILNYNMQQKLKEGHVYVAQITATQRGAKMQSDFDFAMVQNGGKSEYIIFTPDKSNGLPTVDTDKEDNENEGENDNGDEDEDEDEEEDDLDLQLLGVDYEIGEDDAKYVFRNPMVVKPEVDKVVFGGNNLESEWERPAFVGGVGEKPDTLKFRYHVKIWTLSGYANAEEALQHDPFYEAYVKGKMPEDPASAKPLPKVGELPADDQETAVDILEDYINWGDVEKFVSMNDVLLMRVIPECINEESVRFFDDDINSVAYTYSDKLSEAFGNTCANGSIQENLKPISISDADMKGKEIHVGEYIMEMGADVKQEAGSWSGSGWILWTPMGQKVKVGVKFEGIHINSDYIMYDGVVKSESKSNWDHLKERANKLKDELTDTKDLEEWIPDDIFTDWGLDNLVGAATPDALKSYVEGHKKDMADGVNSLAQKVKASKYYDYVRKGYAVYENFMNGDYGSMPDIEVFLPLQLPKKINPSPVDIQVISMEWEPTRAWMNLIGMTTLPDNDITEENILMFGAPRTCMDPDRILPGTGNIILLEDLKLNDPKSDFTIKFFAPENKEKPEDGCMIHWEDDKLQMLSVKAEMEIPDLIKCDEQGKRIEGELPKMLVEGKVEDWENWYASVTMDPFEHEDLPGWTFTAKDVTLDLSVKQNHPDMSFPVGYDKKHFPKTKFNADDAWTGLFIKEVTVMLPEGFLKNGDKRFSISGMGMLFDKSGVTASIGLKDPVDASVDDWALRIKKVAINILQNDFNGCGMDGDIHVPLTEDDDYIAFNCDMIPVKHNRKKSTADNSNPEEAKETTFDFLLKIQPTKDGENALDGKLKFDFWLATLKLANKQTYFLLEATDKGDKQGYDTKVELCMAGEISIGGEKVSSWIQEKLDKLPLKVEMPGIHFTQMRLSNRKRSEAWVYGEAVRKAAQDAYEEDGKKSTLAILGKNETIEFGSPDSPCYFDCGNWSVASAEKKIGPFSFSIEGFDYGKIDGCDSVYVEATGKIGFISNGSEPIVTAGTSLRLNAEMNIKQKKLKYAGIDFLGCSLDIKTAGMRIYGKLDMGGYDDPESHDHDNGYNGELEFTMPGDLFSIGASGGYYEHKAAEGSTTDKNYSWGYFKAMMDSKAGIHADPLVINRIAGGFYFNCRPTKSDADPKDKFGGVPVRQYGPIGIALGMTMSTTAGEDVLKSDVDLLVVYNKETKRLSTFMFNGKLEAVGGIVKADVSLIYEHTTMNQAKIEEGPIDTKLAKQEATKDRYLCLNVTVEFGLDSDKLKEKIVGANSKLLDVKADMDAFQAGLDKIDLKSLGKEAPMQSLNQLSGDYEKNADGVAKEGDEDTSDTKKKEGDTTDFSAGKGKIALELLITWAKDGEVYPTPKWHLYVGEPAKDKRCTYTYLKFNSSICSVDIGADGYLCLGNELPDNGALPAIPTKISEFLAGHQNEGTNMGADLQKAERSRAKAAKALLDPTSMNGGVMVGASCWGEIHLNLGLIYGDIESLAGFDASLINYGSNAVCANSRSHMGKNGWYALGQLYAYLYAQLGVHIKIGKLIDEKVSLIEAGIGGVLETGLPNPSWVEGQVRVKMSFLGGLFKLNKRFDFAAGDHCVPFRGNALDGFELFQNVSLGSDSLYEALYKPEFAITKQEAQQMTFTTNTSLGSHYRLVDPSYVEDMAKETGEDKEKLSLHASRTYVFDMNQNLNQNGMKMGVRLFDLGEKPTQLANSGKLLSPNEFRKQMMSKGNGTYDGIDSEAAMKQQLRSEVLANTLSNMGSSFTNLGSFLSAYFNTKEKTCAETSFIMDGKDSKKIKGVLDDTNLASYIDQILTYSDFKDGEEVNVSFRENKGTTFHLTGLSELKPGHSYALVLMGDAYEIDNGQRVWCDYYDEKTNKYHRIQWRQSKLWFFRIKSNAEDKVDVKSLKDLTPYVALAYPSVDGTKVKNRVEDPSLAYFGDIMQPTIALNRNLSTDLPEDKLKWILTAYDAKEYASNDTTCWKEVQTIDADYVTGDNCINLQPANAFSRVKKFSNEIQAKGRGYNYDNELYHLQLAYYYRLPKAEKDTVNYIVDLWLQTAPHGVHIDGMKDNQDDSWMQSTNRSVTGELLPYVAPFVGASPSVSPQFNYEFKDASGNFLTDDDIVFKNVKFKNSTPYRLIDPWMYLAYLSKWTFVGDRKLNAYDFDRINTLFGSESLIFDNNGTVVNSTNLRDKEGKSLVFLRDDMYKTWDDWNFYGTKNYLPQWPLPSTMKGNSMITAANQYGLVSTVSPRVLGVAQNDYNFAFAEVAKDFMAPYTVADLLSYKLRDNAQELWECFACMWNDADSTVISDDNINEQVRHWNDLHRGQYLEVSERGVTARVPMYQLPLIFGGCFGFDSDKSTTYKGTQLSLMKRGFKSSVSNVETNKRWQPDVANLLFFRLLGNKALTWYDNVPPQVFQTMSNSGYSASYSGTRQVALDVFNSNRALKEVSKFEARMYRVDAYDIETGMYHMKNRAAEPRVDYFQIGEGHDLKTMADMSSSIIQTEQNMLAYSEYATPWAIYTESDKTLTLLYSNENYSLKSDYGKEQIALGGRFRDDEVLRHEWTANAAIRTKVEKVVIDKSFKQVELQDLSYWFTGCEKLKSVEGLDNLNTANVTTMDAMFSGCKSIEKLNLSSFDTRNLRQMNAMFNNCANLNTLNVKGFNTQNVVQMSRLFKGCASLTSLDLSTFSGESVGKCAEMFNGCSKLSTLRIPAFNADEFIRTSDACQKMFVSVPSNLVSYINILLKEEIKEQIPGRKNVDNSTMRAILAENREGKNVLIFMYDPNDLKIGYSGDVKGRYANYSGLTVKKVFKGDQVLNTGTSIPEWTSDKNLVKVIFDKSFAVSPTSMYSWFKDCENLTKIEGAKNLNTKHVKNMAFLLSGCSNLQSADFVQSFNTDEVENMSYMFNGCKQLEKICLYDVVASLKGSYKAFNTENVKNMSYMFANCENMTEITLGEYFDLGNVENMESMFKGCKLLKNILRERGLRELTIANNARYLQSMFNGCESIKNLDFFLKLIGTSSFKYGRLSNMFKNCKSLTELDLSQFVINEFDVSSSYMSYMFEGCSSLKKLLLSGFVVSNLTYCNDMFKGVPNDCYIFLPYNTSSKIHTEQVSKQTYPNLVLVYPAKVLLVGSGSNKELFFLNTEKEYKAGGTYEGKKIVSVWGGSEVYSGTEGAFFTVAPWNGGNSAIKDIVKVTFTPDFKGVLPITMRSWFEGMTNLSEFVGMENLNTSQVKDMTSAFRGCESLKSLDLSYFKTSNVEDMAFMFYNCKSLTELDLSSFDTHNVRRMANMFDNCFKLKKVDMSSFNTANITNISSMFSGCKSLEKVDVSSFDTRNTEYMGYMFYGCSSLTELDLSNFDTSKAPGQILFYGCSSLRTLSVGTGFRGMKRQGTDVTGESYINDTFKGVHDLNVYVKSDEFERIRGELLEVGFVEGVTGQIYGPGTTLIPQAIWTEGNSTLTFTNIPSVKVGDTFAGQAVTAVWSGTDITNTPLNGQDVPWKRTVSDKVKKVVFNPSFSSVTPKRTAYWFAFNKVLNDIEGLNNLNTSEVENMESMFQNCEYLSKLDLRNFNTENVTSMKSMFSGCNSLKSLNVSGFNTSNVTNMDGMFYKCGLDVLDISDFNTNKVTNANYMFGYIPGLTPAAKSVKALMVGPEFKFSNMSTKASGVFYNVKDMMMTYVLKPGTNRLWAMDVKDAVVNKLGFVEDTNGRFVYSWSKVAQVIWTEDNQTLSFICDDKEYKKGDIFNGKTVTSVWSGEEVINSPISPEWRKNIIAWGGYVANGSTWTSCTVVIDPSFSVVKPKSMANWFSFGGKLLTIRGVEYLNTEDATSMEGMFSGCRASKLDVSNFNTHNVTSMYNMFAACKNLTTLDVSNFSTENVTTMAQMFNGCSKLETLNLGNLDISHVKSMIQMFMGCKNLKQLTINAEASSELKYIDGMFSSCSQLTSIDMSNFIIWFSKFPSVNSLFNGCSSLKTLQLSEGFCFSTTSDFTSSKNFNQVSGMKVIIDTSYEYQVDAIKNNLNMMGFTNSNGTIEIKKK